MDDKIYDAVIVGAGPAGSFAAERLAQSGARIALFDGRPPSEPKACGGGVTSKALKAWPHLLEAVAHRVDEVDIYAPSGRRIRVPLAEPFAVYSRRTLDSFLRERARRAGADIFTERVAVEEEKSANGTWMVRANTSGARWSGEILVAADGTNSRIAQRLAGKLSPSEMEVAFGYRAPLPREGVVRPTVIAFLPGWVGYAWAFPRLDHISFGVATAQDEFDHTTLDNLLWRFMVGYYRLYKKDARSDRNAALWELDKPSERDALDVETEAKLHTVVERYAARIPGLAPATWDTRHVAGKDWALLGDAAGFADPVTGEGIYYALRSAELFAEAFLKGDVVSYEESWRADFGHELRRASQMRRRFYGTFLGAPFIERMVAMAGAHRGIRRTLGELIAGDQGYVNLKSKLARRMFRPF